MNTISSIRSASPAENLQFEFSGKTREDILSPLENDPNLLPEGPSKVAESVAETAKGSGLTDSNSAGIADIMPAQERPSSTVNFLKPLEKFLEADWFYFKKIQHLKKDAQCPTVEEMRTTYKRHAMMYTAMASVPQVTQKSNLSLWQRFIKWLGFCKHSQIQAQDSIQSKYEFINTFFCHLTYYYKTENQKRTNERNFNQIFDCKEFLDTKLKNIFNAVLDKISVPFWHYLCPWKWFSISSLEALKGSCQLDAGQFFLSVLKKYEPKEKFVALKTLNLFNQLALINAAGGAQISNTPKNCRTDVANFIIEYMMRFLNPAMQNLAPGGELLIPIGTTDHAILLRVRKEEEQEYTVTVFNTGEGCQKHKRHINWRKLDVDREPLTYRINKENTDNPLFNKKFWQDLFMIQLVESDASKVYKALSTYFSEEDRCNSEKRYHAQERGTCCFSSFHAYFATTFNEKDFETLREGVLKKIKGYFTYIEKSKFTSIFPMADDSSNPAVLKLKTTARYMQSLLQRKSLLQRAFAWD